MRYKDIHEAVSDLLVHGDLENPGTFRTSDLKRIADPVWRERVINIFTRSPVPITLHIVHGPDSERGAYIKLTSSGWIDRKYLKDYGQYMGQQSEQFTEYVLGPNFKKEPEGLTVVYTHNEGDARIAFTPWIVAHRMCHGFLDNDGGSRLNTFSKYRQDINNLLNSFLFSVDGIDKSGDVRRYLHKLGVSKANRSQNLRQDGEIVHEMFAKFITTGRVTLDKKWLTTTGIDYDIPKRNQVQELIRSNSDHGLAIPYYDDSYDNVYNLKKLFNAMKGNPLRPKTLNALKTEIQNMDDQGLWNETPKHNESDDRRIYHHTLNFERNINIKFTQMVEAGKGMILFI
jgi:hypothetical protein